MKITAEEMHDILREAGLEGAGDGVIFPWGAKIVELDGKKLLQPMTPDEYARAVEEETGRVLTPEELLTPRCSYASSGCVSQGCRQAGGFCSMHHNINGMYCLCNY